MKNSLFLILLSGLVTLNIFGQTDEYTKAIHYLAKKGEVYFTFSITYKNEISEITKVISIDKVDGLKVYAYANTQEFESFITIFNYTYFVLTHPGDLLTDIRMYEFDQRIAYNYDTYPTYNAYLEIMNHFQTKYPGLCKIVEIGTSVNNRKLLFAKISDNVNTAENEGKFMYTSTMHGDETTGYILMLRLIDYLLSNYETNSEITNLINNLEIWINPLANPDGTYKAGNTNPLSPIRYNANGADLNRNFPDPEDGDHPDGKAWQPETKAFMTIAEQNNFIMSANFHGGAEVVCYPWDTWAQKHPEDAWFQEVSHLYANLAQVNSPSGYMEGFNDGISNGFAWYEVNGGRQDYMNYFRNCREITIELSNAKFLAENQLNNLWSYNYQSLLALITKSLELINCVNDIIITENIIGGTQEFLASNSINASNNISNAANVHYGANNRIILQNGFKAYTGTHFLANLNGCTISSLRSENIYPPIILENYTIENINHKYLKAENSEKYNIDIYPNPTDGILYVKGLTDMDVTVYDLTGRVIQKIAKVDENINFSDIKPGIYMVHIKSAGKLYKYKIIKQ